MRKHIIYTVILASVLLFGFKTITDKGNARAKQLQGMYIFHFSDPQNDYTYLGTVKIPGVVWSKDPDTFLKSLLKRAKSDYPSANGLIITDDYQQADAIIIKE